MNAFVKPPYSIVCLCCLLLIVSCKPKTLFKELSSSETGIHFNNKIVETDSLNPLDNTNIYNGGGVGIGDFNNDGLQDVYFTGNEVPNKLYLNKGKLKFQDITTEAGVDGQGRWSRGVAVVDINNDGWQDIYVCATFSNDVRKRVNMLYINQGTDKNGIPHFKDMAAEYGLADTSHSTMAEFFDYDNDGDLDMYLVVNQIVKGDNASVFRPKITNGSHPSTGKLYRNDWNPTLKHAVFTDVSKEAGTTIEGYGHSATIADFNKDGWKDIFVTNDFNSNDLLYINNHDGTFTDKAAIYFKHTSANGMGQDIIDINNDGLSDVVELDMNPQDNYRKKMMMGGNNYLNYQNSDYFHYQYQYVRNTLQLNQGPRVNGNDSIGDPIFSDVGFFSGVAETDWSWTPLVTDFDNDGYRDLIVTNGYPRDVTDHDFIAFRRQSTNLASKDLILKQIPQVKLHNYAFRNNGNVTFNDVSSKWGLTTPSFSNGAVYADLDNDGDMDVVVNNIDDEASVYENTSRNKKEGIDHYLTLQLKGDSLNRNGLGAWIEIYYNGKQQTYEQTPYRGYLSTIDIRPHFGLGNIAKVDSLKVIWPDNKMQVLQNVLVDRIVTLDQNNASGAYNWSIPLFAPNTLFREVTDSLGIHYTQVQKDFIDFNIQKLLPHKFSEYGPALAVGDVDGNGLDDMVVGGANTHSTVLLLQQPNGKFIQKDIIANANYTNKTWEDKGITLFDADGDGDLDLFVASGGYENDENSEGYQDHLFINDGKGNFTMDAAALPQNHTSKLCVRVADYDRDGDLDLFIAGRVKPGKYPQPVSSFIYRNDSKNGVVKFTDVTAQVAPMLQNIGLTCDAVWTDFDNDGWQDLVLTGEWMPITFIKNNRGVFKDVTPASTIGAKKGWWTSILPGDFDNDGDIDYVVGNLGLNSFFKASDTYPVSIYGNDFDRNGVYDAVTTLYLPSSQEDTTRLEYPADTRDDIIKQMTFFRLKFPIYKSFATAPFSRMFTEQEMEGTLKLQANYFSNSYIRNDGNGKFTIMPLPLATQYACMNGMVTEDFDGDGNLDVLLVGNDYGTQPSLGRYDACNGLFLKGDGKGNFQPLSILQSGWFVPGDAKALVKLRSSGGKCLLAASQNKSNLKVFELKKPVSYIPLQPLDVSAIITYKNGHKQKRELYYGASFLSQSGRFLNVDANIASVQIQDAKGNVRNISL